MSSSKYVFDEGEVPVFRADGVQCMGTRWTATVTLLGSQVKPGPQGDLTILDVPLSHVRVSWPLAKALHALLGELVNAHEEAEGEIKLPKSFLAMRGATE